MDTLDIVLLVVLVIVVVINCCHKLYNYNNDYVFEPSEPKSTPSGALDQLDSTREPPIPKPSEPVKHKKSKKSKKQAEPKKQEKPKGFISGQTQEVEIPVEHHSTSHTRMATTKKMLYEDYDMDKVAPTIDSPEQAQYYRGATEDDVLVPAPVFNLNSKIFNTLEQFKKMYELSHDDSEPQGFISGQTQDSEPQGFISGQTQDDGEDNSVTLHMVWADWCGYSQKAKKEWPKVKEMVGDMYKNVKVKFEDILEKDNKDRIKKEFSDLNGFPNHFIKGMVNGKQVNTKFNGVEAQDIVKKLKDGIEKHL